MPALTVCFTDTDQDLTPVDAVLRENGIEYVVRQCKTPADLVLNCQGFEVLVNQYTPLTEEAFAGLKDLKVVVRYGVGVDHIDIPAATRHGVTICNVPDGCTNEVADHGAAMLLALARKIVLLNQKARQGKSSFQDAIPLFRLNTCTLGLIGVGRIGIALATRMRGFGMRFLGFDEYARQKKHQPRLYRIDRYGTGSRRVGFHFHPLPARRQPRPYRCGGIGQDEEDGLYYQRGPRRHH